MIVAEWVAIGRIDQRAEGPNQPAEDWKSNMSTGSRRARGWLTCSSDWNGGAFANLFRVTYVVLSSSDLLVLVHRIPILTTVQLEE